MNQKRTIMGACDYSLETLKEIKKQLSEVDSKESVLNWAVGGIICTLCAQLLHLCNSTIVESAKLGESDAKVDIRKIQKQFNHFINEMVENG